MSDLKKLLRRLQRALNSKDKLEALEDIAEHYYTSRDYRNALKYYEEELEEALSLSVPDKIAKSHRMIGEVKLELCEYDEALKHTKKYYDYTKTCNSLLEEQRALTTLGRTYLVQADNMPDKDSAQCKKAYENASLALWKSLELCEKLQNEVNSNELNEMRARSMLNLGLTYEGFQDFEEAIRQFDRAMKLCRKHKLDVVLKSCCCSCASVFMQQQKFDDALNLFEEAKAALKSFPDKERVKDTVDILFVESECYILKEEVHLARKTLQKAYKMAEKPCREDVSNRLKLVAAMDLHFKKLKNLVLTPQEKFKIHEELGDAFSSFRMFSVALKHYEEMLKFGKIAECNLKACYVSLAQTCKDLKEYEKALSYFEQELKLCQKSEDICESLLNIQEIQEILNVSISDQLCILQKAFSIVEKEDNQKLKRKVFIELEKVQRAALLIDEADETKSKLDGLRVTLSDSESDDEEEIEHTPNIGEYIDLDALSDCSEEDEEQFENKCSAPNNQASRRNPKRSNAALWRRNEKGETKLHTACIAGNEKAVRTLLAQGCEVNATDNAGWTPLHEAANHGFLDIVELLLENGANINHRGGAAAGGITPLYDAAQAGNFDVMEVLLDHKASASVLSDKGESVLDALNSFYERGHSTMTSEDKQQFSCVKDRLVGCLEKDGIFPKERKIAICDGKKGSLPSCAGKLRRAVNDDYLDDPPHKKRSMREISPVSINSHSSSDDENKVLPDADEGKQSVSEYISAIQNLRKIADSPISEPRKKNNFQPLISESEVVDNWLEDDIGEQPSKKRRKSDQSFSSSYKPRSLKKKSTSRLSLNSCSSSRLSVSSTEARDETRLSSGSRNSDVFFEGTSRYFDDDIQIETFDNEIIDNSSVNLPASDVGSLSSSNLNNTRQSSILSFGITRQPGSQCSTVPQSAVTHIVSSPNRVNVRVEDHLLAIFVQNPNLTIGWLATEAANRYKKLDGCEPVLSIYSLDGALYSEEDPVQMVVGCDVVGKVDSWKDSSITERYMDACMMVSSEKHDNILSCLEACQATRSLDIADTLHSSQIFKPAFRAISMERNLIRISLPNNNLDDKGVKDLCANLGKLFNLRELDLSGNNLSALAVVELANAARKGFLKALTSLNISHNNLGDASLPELVELTAATPCLENLSLADCMFSKSVWDRCDKFLTLNNLQSLDLSMNSLHAKGLAGFLGFSDYRQDRRLNPDKLKNLYLIGLQGERLCQEIQLFLEQGSSISLRELHLSYSMMQDEEILLLASVLRNASELHTLRLPGAKNIKASTVCELLLTHNLKNLEIHNSKLLWGDSHSSDIVSAITHAAMNSLETLTLRDVPESGKEAWCALKGSSSIVRRSAFGLCQLSCGTI
ncbi:Tonsoku-like protein [Frankliniella fusca]|uniref:Tonsoku-like protein n=1 Tax=Frankliniella fusca TaxID=407009 RepID=A0AAE1I0T4_9NEOP|nr:Tonsoku-like protein [Frankliniella fusca]